MPTYGYRCSDCKHEFEIFQKMSDTPLSVCEKCGGPLKKILYPVGISFKGEGFYVNDSQKSSGGGKKAEEKAETAPDSAASTGGDSGTASSGEVKAAETKSPAPTPAPAATGKTTE